MNGNLAYGLGFVAFVVIFSAILIIPMLIGITKDKKLKRKYDERQEAIRGRGFKAAFYTVIVLNMLYATAMIGFEKLPIEPAAMLYIIAIMGVGVYAWYCILNDGYFALNEKVPQTIAAFTAIAVFNLIIGISTLLDGDVVVDGVVQFDCMNIVCAIFMVITIAVILIKRGLDKRED